MITLMVNSRMKKSSPVIFKPGDIVEVVAALVCIPVMDQCYKLLLKLCGLMLLDTSMCPVSGITFVVDGHIT